MSNRRISRNPKMHMQSQKTILERFEEKFIPEPNSGCWLLFNKGSKEGHGIIRYNDGYIGTHVLSHILYKGPVPKGMYVLHKCDVPSCVNPDHLFLGTARQNVADMISKGRAKFKQRKSALL